MSVVDSYLMTSEQRPLALRRRDDLVIQESAFQGQRCWIIKDPLALTYFRLQEPEYLVFQQLDGRTSLQQIKNLLENRFPDRTTRFSDLQNLISSLHQKSLLVVDGPGQAEALLKRRVQMRRQKLLGAMSNIIAIRFPGVDPDRLLNRLYPRVRWFFSRGCAALCAAVALGAVLLVLTQFSEFQRRLPDFYAFFGARNLLLMAVLLIITKTLHELGHGLMCKHFGGECHEIGVMLLVLMPAAYCNTSDSWILPSKWKRMAIGAGGMYVEVVLAAFCTFVWWFTNPGFVHYVCLNVMFLCSVSTVVFNGNPLLRYDGYYILSDWLEIPNLTQKSRAALLSKLRVWCLGMKPIPSRLLPERRQWLFAIYSIASLAYRWFILIMILWFLSKVFEPWGLQVIGQFLVAVALVGLVVVPLWKLLKFFSYPGRLREVKRNRLVATTIVAGVLLVLFCFLPLPYHVGATAVISPSDAGHVHVQVPGDLQQCLVQPGQQVQVGQVLAVLQNPAPRLALQKTQGEIFQLQHEIALLELSFDRIPDSRGLVEKRAQLAGAVREEQKLQKQLQQLTLRAPCNGTVIPPPFLSPPQQPELELATWSGSPLSADNRYAYLEPDTLFCIVGHPAQNKATLVIDQSDIGLVRPGNRVVLMLDEYPGQRLSGTIQEISRGNLDIAPRELSQSAGGPMATRPDPSGRETAMFTSYQAVVPLPGDTSHLLQGFRGQAKIRVGSASLGWRLVRYIQKIVNFG